jgi:hypothetical protein
MLKVGKGASKTVGALWAPLYSPAKSVHARHALRA